jgi:TetR/AcrR family transcriptional repressor of bet genes
MNSAATITASRKRTEPKEKRKTQLIQATIRSIAKHGLSDTTIATVAREAGLSQGIINLHFQSKERLLLETLSFVVDEYKACWEKAFESAGEASADRLAALVEVDFYSAVCDRNKLAVWFAFWSETKSRPTYRRLCADRDRGYDEMMKTLCRDVVREGGYDIDPDIAARGLAAMTEGLWLDMLLSPRSMTRQQARRISMAYLGSLFPDHFGGPVRHREAR